MHGQGQAKFRLGLQYMHRQGQALFRLGSQHMHIAQAYRDRLFLG
jgi:hypothetical protein